MKSSILFTVAAATVILAGCSSAAVPAPTVTVTEKQTVTSEPYVDEQDDNAVSTDADSAYLSMLNSKGIVADPETSIEVGHMVCDALDDGYTGVEMVGVAKSSGFTTEQGAAIVAAAVIAYCPWNKEQALS